jgi:hypothetical protein
MLYFHLIEEREEKESKKKKIALGVEGFPMVDGPTLLAVLWVAAFRCN